MDRGSNPGPRTVGMDLPKYCGSLLSSRNVPSGSKFYCSNLITPIISNSRLFVIVNMLHRMLLRIFFEFIKLLNLELLEKLLTET